MEDRPLCFVLMPFGSKRDPAGGPDIDFNAIYEKGLQPGIEDAGMQPIRADEEQTGGIIHKAMFERLLLCDFAVADLTTANPNVFYELGVRHAVRPATTLPVFAAKTPLPFDVNYMRSLPYQLSETNQLNEGTAKELRGAVARRLTELRDLAAESAVDSPLFQLLTEYPPPDLAHLKTDIFRDRERYSASMKQRLEEARSSKDPRNVAAIEAALPAIKTVETGVLVDLFISYRAVEAYDRMLALYERMPQPLQRTVMVREQLGFALNRLKRRDEALKVLQKVVEDGGSSETYGLIGRIYKDKWIDATKEQKTWEARGYLDRAIASYVQGFECDWRDAYPGINAVTLLDIKGDRPSLERKEEILPIVRYAVVRRLKSSQPNYWDHATLLELGVLANDADAARQSLSDTLSSPHEPWQASTTANNLELIQKARAERGSDTPWLKEVIDALAAAGAAAKR